MANQNQKQTQQETPAKKVSVGMVGAFAASGLVKRTDVTAEMIRRLVHKLEEKEG